MKGRSQDWGIMMLGAILGAAATAMYYNHCCDLSRVGRRIVGKSRQIIDNAIEGMDNDTSFSTGGK